MDIDVFVSHHPTDLSINIVKMIRNVKFLLILNKLASESKYVLSKLECIFVRII